MNIKDYIGTKDLYKQMFRIAIPISAQSLITMAITLVDTVMLSDMGDAQLSAACLASSYIGVFMICCMGIGMGASVLTSRYWGMKEIGSLKKAITIMLRFCIVFAFLFTLPAIFCPGLVMRIYTSDPEIIHYGIIYLKWLIPCYFCIGFATTTMVVLRSIGQVKIPLIGTIIALLINVFFNWMFIYGNLGMPRMEIGGAALATTVSRFFEMIFVFGYMIVADKNVRYRLRDITMKCGDMVGEYMRISLPVLISDGLLGLGTNAVAMVMGRIGPAFVAANSVTSVVQQLSSILTVGIGNASGIITGHTMGEGDYKKAHREGYTFTFIGVIIGLIGAVIILLIKQPIINFYNVSQEAKAISNDLMDAIVFIITFRSVSSILTKGVLRAGGDTKFLMAGDILFLWIASIPLGALAGLVFHWSSFWVYTLLNIDQIIKCVWCVHRLSTGKWLKKIDVY